MCVVNMGQGDAIHPAATLTKILFNTTTDFITEKNNHDYRTQIALNNAKYAQNEAHRQMQLGIDKSRAQKIAGLTEANKLIAQQGASNLDNSSFNSDLAYQDVIENSNIASKITKNEYNASANSYFKQANAYLNQANSYQKQYNKNLFMSGFNSLGQLNQVANDWYELKSEE
ncbi:MAG: hypothetical protein IJW73_07365 [Candidatus Gastranaerophilales bacterium]|nr:hypothetical protein [Candidatus Gastranaerophilales bacterium]